jgi:hypothetical protein
MRRRSLPIVVLALIAASCIAIACSSATPSATPTVTEAPAPTATPTPLPTPEPSPTTLDPFSGQPYTLTLPAGWTVLNPSDTSMKASLDAFVAANPRLAAAIAAFRSQPNIRMGVNTVLGNVLIVLPIPAAAGIPLETLGQSFTAQFKSVPGVTSKVVASPVTLPAGKALHWDLMISANKTGGGTVHVDESIYLLENASTVVLLEFVTPQGGGVPQEQAIVKSFAFRP